jgi:hypothetical protein
LSFEAGWIYIFEKKEERSKFSMAFLDHIVKGERVGFKNNSVKTKITRATNMPLRMPTSQQKENYSS